jgi:hypothetical protein
MEVAMFRFCQAEAVFRVLGAKDRVAENDRDPSPAVTSRCRGDEFILALHRTINPRDMHRTRVEALIRWKHPVRAAVQPTISSRCSRRPG